MEISSTGRKVVVVPVVPVVLVVLVARGLMY